MQESIEDTLHRATVKQLAQLLPEMPSYCCLVETYNFGF